MKGVNDSQNLQLGSDLVFPFLLLGVSKTLRTLLKIDFKEIDEVNKNK